MPLFELSPIKLNDQFNDFPGAGEWMSYRNQCTNVCVQNRNSDRLGNGVLYASVNPEYFSAAESKKRRRPTRSFTAERAKLS